MDRAVARKHLLTWYNVLTVSISPVLLPVLLSGEG